MVDHPADLPQALRIDASLGQPGNRRVPQVVEAETFQSCPTAGAQPGPMIDPLMSHEPHNLRAARSAISFCKSFFGISPRHEFRNLFLVALRLSASILILMSLSLGFIKLLCSFQFFSSSTGHSKPVISGYLSLPCTKLIAIGVLATYPLFIRETYPRALPSPP